jgi:hypothetical protein
VLQPICGKDGDNSVKVSTESKRVTVNSGITDHLYLATRLDIRAVYRNEKIWTNNASLKDTIYVCGLSVITILWVRLKQRMLE